jgi:hypothetical protein
VVFKFSAKNSFGGQQGLALNEISDALAHPDYITDFISRLRRKRKIFAETVIALQLRLDVADTFSRIAAYRCDESNVTTL